ncbi:arginine--tRNA ligase [Candidatus Nanohalobium constans]|uniref:Arginine--tRNA ligase n=1 Tax=Candidatus Nanohalobium constans TaxID=2565781 RepID=A0A5Q0UGW4_9ARCH|nr:arginine--tRNA ligase [Candidatus Nanohalobium constans]QGA80868.1 arginyl-tRNA synthetase [Candidatus Nanohalobium constans]
MKQIKRELVSKLSEKLDVEVSISDIERPEPEHGDFAYPVMKAASELGENPRQLAEETAESFENHGFIDSVGVAGPGYLNFHLDRESFASQVLEVLETDSMGVEARDGSMLVEFSAPNLAKPMHIGHMRNNVIGDSLQRIMRFIGYEVTSENYIGDWGTKHGQVIYAFKKWGSQEEFDENPMDHMYDLYVKLHDEADEEDKEKAREWSKKIEEGDEEAVRLWEMFREATIEHNEKEYDRMGIEFDRVTGESVVADEAQEVIENGLEKGIFEEDYDGSIYVDFEDDKYPNTVVKRSDGSTLYLSRDVANIQKREEEGFDYNLYIVANEQDLHFQQLFEIAEMFGVEGIQNEHISYGMVHLQDGSISSSKGNIIRLSDLMDKAVDKAAEIEGRDVDNAEEVGLGAIRYANLSVSRSKDINFDWDDVLDFEGDSGPYLQYTNVRAKSILRETEKEGETVGTLEDEEYRLLKKLSEFPEKVEAAADQREPAKIANYLSDLSEEFNSFYHSCQVTGVEEKIEKRRVKLVETFVEVTDQGLELLGIEPLDEM